MLVINNLVLISLGGGDMRWPSSLLRQCATSAGSIPDGVIGIFH